MVTGHLKIVFSFTLSSFPPLGHIFHFLIFFTPPSSFSPEQQLVFRLVCCRLGELGGQQCKVQPGGNIFLVIVFRIAQKRVIIKLIKLLMFFMTTTHPVDNEMGDVLAQVIGPTTKLDPQSEHGAELIYLFVLRLVG